MLRRLNEIAGPGVVGGNPLFPSVDQPFAVEDRPAGVAFYRGSGSFYYPYTLLHSIHLTDEMIRVCFAPAEIVIEGRGLHGIYSHLAAQRLMRIVEQGDRYAEASSAVVFVSKITEIVKEQNLAN